MAATNDDIEGHQARIAAATPLPWFAPAGKREWLFEDCVLTSAEAPQWKDGSGRVLAHMNTNFPYRADLELICDAVNALPAHLTEIKELRSLVQQLMEIGQNACPCMHTTPCHERCTCVVPFSSSGCRRCCVYGSDDQRKAAAVRLAAQAEVAEAAEVYRAVCADVRSDSADRGRAVDALFAALTRWSP